MGSLSVNDFLHYFEEKAQKKGIPIQVVYEVLDLLCKKGVLSEQSFIYTGNDKTFSVNEGYVRFLKHNNALDNLIHGFGYIANKYAKLVLKVVVQTPKGESIGTGFVARCENGLKPWLITNKHVAEHEAMLKVLDSDNNIVPHGQIYCSQNKDIAAIELYDDFGCNVLSFYPSGNLLDEIITLGYPRVPMTKDSFQLVHKGEINALVQDYYHNDFYIISAKTAPGNSGGPVLNLLGMVVGMVTQEFFEKPNEEAVFNLPYHAAIPVSDIIQFMISISS
jgi:S1-C subfamily serine protease